MDDSYANKRASYIISARPGWQMLLKTKYKNIVTLLIEKMCEKQLCIILRLL